MSFIILILIIILLYASLSKYSNLYKVIFMITLVTAMTSVFLIYGLGIFGKSDVFVILNTEMNKTTFFHVCIIWFAADLLVIVKIVKNYKKYISVNS